jgi:UDP-N-acetylglucosamine--N-acetylmuramyl-(pentapeptide) pyrophosphoryl-undecaprenol N-acetylglucosamine transferase
MRVVVSGGGSGGHIFPALAVAESVKRLRPDASILFIGGASGMECQIVPERGVPFQAVTARKLRKVLSPSTIGVGFSLWKGYREARQHLRTFGAEAVVGTGGYVAAGAVLAGAKLGMPTLIVSPDVVPGRTNRLLARYVRRICIAWEPTRAHFAADKCVLTGLPLRAGIVAPPDVSKNLARREFQGLQEEPFTIVVIGGSQGAQAINRLVSEAAPGLLDAGAQILHQTGTRNFESVKAQAQERKLFDRPGYAPVAFLNEAQVPLALRAADVIVCRGGISTLSEAMINGLPAIVIPLPTAYADHQTFNARMLADAGAGWLRPEADLSAADLTNDLLALRNDAARREKMRQAMLGLGRPHAADAVAQEVFKLIADE